MKYNRTTLLPIILFVYTTAMAIYFVPRQPNPEARNQTIITLVVAYLIIIVLWFALRKKEKLAKERQDDMEK